MRAICLQAIANAAECNDLNVKLEDDVLVGPLPAIVSAVATAMWDFGGSADYWKHGGTELEADHVLVEISRLRYEFDRDVCWVS